MTPPTLDLAAAEAKLVLLADLVSDLQRHAEVSGDDLRADRDRRHVVERILTQLVDIAAGLNAMLARAHHGRAPTGYREGFELAARAGVIPAELGDRLELSAGMRNILTHEYGSIDLDIVANAVPMAHRDYGAYVGHVRDHLLAAQDDEPA